MALENRLGRWVEAGLIDKEQARRILEFEKGAARPVFLYAVAGLGALAIGIGAVSIVAANWDKIPGGLKIATNLVLVAGGCAGIIRVSRSGPRWARDALLLVDYGLVLSGIALIGQVYQLGGEAREALTVWSLLTLPLMTLGRSGLLGVTWLAGLQTTYAMWLVWLSEGMVSREGWALAGAGLAPWLLLVVGHSAWVRERRQSYAAVFAFIGWAELLVVASIGANAFYADTLGERWHELWVGLGMGAVCVAWLWRPISRLPGGRVARWLLVSCLGLTYVPGLASPGDLDIVAALAFIGLWLLVAFAAHHAGKSRMLNLATAVIGVRILVVYFEVFGSLLDTGLGLVSGGALALVLVWLWWRKRRDFEQPHGAPAEHAP